MVGGWGDVGALEDEKPLMLLDVSVRRCRIINRRAVTRGSEGSPLLLFVALCCHQFSQGNNNEPGNFCKQ